MINCLKFESQNFFPYYDYKINSPKMHILLDHYLIDMLFIFQECHPFRVLGNLSFVSVLFPSIIPKQYFFVYLHLSG